MEDSERKCSTEPFNFIASYRAAYTSNIQLSPYQTQLIGGAIRTRAPGCRLLVFGAGYDTALWASLNRDGHTLILETSPKWIEIARAQHPGVSIELVPPHGLSVASSLEMSVEEVAKHQPPASLSKQDWDVILVDAPRGYHPTDPGRAIAIAWAAHLAGPATHVFVDDYERPLELKFADGLLRGRPGSASYVIPSSDIAGHRLLFWSAGSPIEQRPSPAVVLTVATQDYAQRWRFCIDSQAKYCRRHGFQHRVLNPSRSSLHPKWAKLEATLDLIRSGTPVLLLDADTEIANSCPAFTDLITSDKDILVANGTSGRPNSGVMVFSPSPDGLAANFLELCLASRLTPLPPEDFVTEEGENGHVIHLLKRPTFAARTTILDGKWNCSDPNLAAGAYIRHYTNRLRASHSLSGAIKKGGEKRRRFSLTNLIETPARSARRIRKHIDRVIHALSG